MIYLYIFIKIIIYSYLYTDCFIYLTVSYWITIKLPIYIILAYKRNISSFIRNIVVHLNLYRWHLNYPVKMRLFQVKQFSSKIQNNIFAWLKVLSCIMVIFQVKKIFLFQLKRLLLIWEFHFFGFNVVI